MVKLCESFYPFLIIAVIVALFLGLAVQQHLQLRRKRTNGLVRQSTRLLMSMLAVALLGIVIFVAYILGPQTGC